MLSERASMFSMRVYLIFLGAGSLVPPRVSPVFLGERPLTFHGGGLFICLRRGRIFTLGCVPIFPGQARENREAIPRETEENPQGK